MTPGFTRSVAVRLVLAAVAAASAATLHERVARDPSVEAVVATQAADVGSFWEQRLPEVFGVEYGPATRVIPHWPSRPATRPPCDGRVQPPRSYVDNALYCQNEDTIVYDAEGLMQRVLDDFGPLAVGVVVAHEHAHAVQARVGLPVDELQADCLAGAWVAEWDEQRPTGETEHAVTGVRAMYASGLRSSPDADGPAAHRDGLERTAVFAVGLRDGVKGCLTRPSRSR